MESFKGSPVAAVVRDLLGKPNLGLSSKSELRCGSRGSLAIDLEAGTWFDHETNQGGGLVDLTCQKSGRTRKDAADWLKSQGINLPAPAFRKPRIEKTYDYRCEEGRTLYQVVRFEPKGFKQRRPDGRGGWIWSLKGCQRVLYRLPELVAADPQHPVYLVEGEKDADRLAALGLVTTTNSGGANKWRDDYCNALRGRVVVILADNDTAGSDHAKTVISALTGVAKHVVRLDLPGLPEKGDVSDWLEAGGCATELQAMAAEPVADSQEKTLPEADPQAIGQVGAAPSSSNQSSDQMPEPIPLMRIEEPAEQVPLQHLGPLRPAVEAIEVLTQAPHGICLQSVLGVVSLAVQGLADVETLVGPTPTSLSLLTIAKSGERKSACDKLALASLRDIEHARLVDYRKALDGHRVKLDLYEAKRKAILRASDTIEREADLEALGPPPAPPLAPHLIFGDPTLEGLMRHYDEGQPSVGVFSDEGGQLLGGHAMNSENKLKTAAAFSKIWDGAEINRARASAPATRYYNRRLACHLMVQPLVAEKLLGDPTIRDQGLLSRMLIAWPASKIGFRSDPTDAARAAANEGLEEFHKRIQNLLDRPLPTEADPKKLAVPTLSLGDDARLLLQRFAASVEASQRPNGPCAGIHGVASKATEQAARIAGVMTLFSEPEAKEVSVEIMAAATGLVDWYLREARRLLDTGLVKSQTADSKVLRSRLIDRRKDEVIDVRTIVRFGPRPLRDTSVIRSLVAILEQHGWIAPFPGPARTKKWKVVRP